MCSSSVIECQVRGHHREQSDEAGVYLISAVVAPFFAAAEVRADFSTLEATLAFLVGSFLYVLGSFQVTLTLDMMFMRVVVKEP